MMVISKEIDFQIHLILKITCVSIPLEVQNNIYRITRLRRIYFRPDTKIS